MSRVGAGTAVNMTVDSAEVSDGNWHRVTLHSQGRGLRLLLDGHRVGDELDSAGVHDFLDPYLTSIAVGGSRSTEGVISKFQNNLLINFKVKCTGKYFCLVLLLYQGYLNFF
jgi:Laminin G domain